MLLLLWDQKLMDQSLMASSSPCAHRTIVQSKLATIISCKIPFISKFVLWKKWKFERKISPKFTVWSVKFVVNRSVSKLVQVFPLNQSGWNFFDFEIFDFFFSNGLKGNCTINEALSAQQDCSTNTIQWMVSMLWVSVAKLPVVVLCMQDGC